MSDEKPKKIEVETYAGDLDKLITENKDGVIKKIIEEEEAQKEELEKNSPDSKNNKTFMIVSVVLVVLAVVAISAVFLLRKQIFTVEVAPQYVPLIFTDKTEFKDITDLKKEQVAQTLLNEISNLEVKTGGVEGIYFTNNKNIVGLRKFLTQIEANLDQKEIFFMNDNFLTGITNLSTKNLFFLIKMRSVADVFKPMALWENKMFLDLHQFFGVELTPDTKYLLEKNFEDGIVQNKNARILYDKEGRIVLMYVYTEDDSLVITNSEMATKEIITRLASSKVKK